LQLALLTRIVILHQGEPGQVVSREVPAIVLSCVFQVGIKAFITALEENLSALVKDEVQCLMPIDISVMRIGFLHDLIDCCNLFFVDSQRHYLLFQTGVVYSAIVINGTQAILFASSIIKREFV
jgi:hypothetical protein